MKGWAQAGRGDAKTALADLGKLEGPEWYALFVNFHTALIAERAGIDLETAARQKLAKNALNYPVEKSYGTSRKYTELDKT